MITMNFNDMHWWNKMGDSWAISKLKCVFLSACELLSRVWEALLKYRSRFKGFICAARYLRGDRRYCVYVYMFTIPDYHLTNNRINWGTQGTCAALSNQQSPWSGPSLLLSSDCFCMSQSLQDIRPLFTAMLNSLNWFALLLFLHTEQNVINIWCPESMLELCYYLHRLPLKLLREVLNGCQLEGNYSTLRIWFCHTERTNYWFSRNHSVRKYNGLGLQYRKPKTMYTRS